MPKNEVIIQIKYSYYPHSKLYFFTVWYMGWNPGSLEHTQQNYYNCHWNQAHIFQHQGQYVRSLYGINIICNRIVFMYNFAAEQWFNENGKWGGCSEWRRFYWHEEQRWGLHTIVNIFHREGWTWGGWWFLCTCCLCFFAHVIVCLIERNRQI